MTDHSPTSVEDWMRCPTFWWWRHERRWTPKSIGPNDLAAWFGRAIDRGVKALYAGQPDGTQHALDELTEAVEEAQAWGRDDPPTNLSEMRTRIRQTLAAYRPEPWDIVAIDHRIGRAVLDLVIRENEGLAVVDIKTKQKKPRDPYWGRQLQEWRKSWQLADYRDRLSREGLNPGSSLGVSVSAYVHAIVAEPFEVVTHSITPDPGWAQDRRSLEALMTWHAQGGLTVNGLTRWRNRSRCHDWFGGDCPMLKACWDYEGCEERFPLDYVQRPGQRPASTLDRR